MAAAAISRPGGRRKRALGQAAALIVMLSILVFLWKRTRPERLTRVPDPPFTIIGEDLYWPKAPDDFATQKEYTIQGQSIYGGKPRTISREDDRSEFYSDTDGSLKRLSAVDGDLVYASMSRREHRFNRMSIFRGAPPGLGRGRGFLGVFLPPLKTSSKEIAAQKRVAPPRRLPAQQEIRFRHVSVQKGTSQDLVSLRGRNFILIGKSVFWIRPKPEERNEVDQGNTSHLEITPHSDLMLTTLADGATHCLRTGLPANTSLIQGETGVVWTEPQPFPEPSALFYARVADGSVCSLGPDTTMATAPQAVEFAQRCYWTAASSDTTQPDQSQVLMSANLDGSDRCVVFSQVDTHPVAQLALATQQGNLYCTLAKISPLKDSRAGYPKYLCRVNPKRADPVEILRALPQDCQPCQFADGYLYFILTEKHRTAWQSLTSDETADVWTQTLCRFPLD